MAKSKKLPTTIKISGELIEKIEKVKSPSKPLTTYVREAIERDISRELVEKSGKAYSEFISKNPEEAEWLKDWESVRLESSVLKKGSKS